ncbi:MAG TPA: SMC family ATPase [Gemmatimonadales bacterium]|nr:SMC family ATPase [Gemmatimonadales bacterium]
MQIHRLRLQNFRQHELTELELGPGLTGIVGPNGAGKTTLLEAIAYAMYGMPAARGNRDTIRRRNAPPRSKVEVELVFSLGAHQYRVVRGLTTAELYQDGEPVPIANSLAAVTERVTRLLGMTRDEFFNTYFTGQKELAVMAAMSPSERAQFLSRVLGYERIRTAQERLRDKRTGLKGRLDALRAGLVDPGELEAEAARADERARAAEIQAAGAAAAFEAAAARYAEVHPRWEQLQQLRERALALESEIRVAGHQVSAAAERLGRLETQAAEARTAKDKLDELWRALEPLAALREEAETLRKQADAFATRQKYQAQLDEVRARVAAAEERLARLPAPELVAQAERRLADVRAQLAAVVLETEERRTAWVRDAQDAKTKRQGLLDQFRELKEQRERILKAGREGDCPTCARPLGAEFETVLGVLDRQLEEVRFNGNFYKQRIEQLDQEPAELVEADARRVALERELGRERFGALGRHPHPLGLQRERLQRGNAALHLVVAGAIVRAGEPLERRFQVAHARDEPGALLAHRRRVLHLG